MPNNSPKIERFLNGQEIYDKVFEGDANIRRASLDLRVDCVIIDGNIIKKDVIKIKAQGMFTVILKGRVKIPNNCFGIAYPKTGLCQRGIHILNTGIIDPGYDGYISTVAINFSNKGAEIRKDEVYLRLTIFEGQIDYSTVRGETPVTTTYDEYINKRVSESEEYPDTFLDVKNQVKNMANEMASLVSSNITNKVLYALTTITVVVSIGTYLLGNTNLDKLRDSYLQKISDMAEISSNEDIQELNRKYSEILVKVNQLEAKEVNLGVDDIEKIEPNQDIEELNKKYEELLVKIKELETNKANLGGGDINEQP